MEVKKLWFENDKIYILTTEGKTCGSRCCGILGSFMRATRSGKNTVSTRWEYAGKSWTRTFLSRASSTTTPNRETLPACKVI